MLALHLDQVGGRNDQVLGGFDASGAFLHDELFVEREEGVGYLAFDLVQTCHR